MFDSNNTSNNSTILSSDAWQSVTRYSPFTQSIQNTIPSSILF